MHLLSACTSIIHRSATLTLEVAEVIDWTGQIRWQIAPRGMSQQMGLGGGDLVSAIVEGGTQQGFGQSIV